MAVFHRFLRSVVVLALIFISTAKSYQRCPSISGVFEFGSDGCLALISLKHQAMHEETERSYSFADSQCRKLKIGNLTWRVPKLNSQEKNQILRRALTKNRESKGSNVWIGLRRYGERNTSETDWIDPKHWFWTDNSSLAELAYSQPINF